MDAGGAIRYLCGVKSEPFNEDADIRAGLSSLGPTALADLRRVLEAPASYRGAVVRALAFGPYPTELATLLAMADTDETVRLRLLRAIRDIDPEAF
jgi:hypothetical protein